MPWWFDRPLLRVLTCQWDGTAVKDYSDYIRRHEESIPPPIAAAVQNIDTEGTGLLTHVSMVSAGLGLVAPVVADHRIEQGIIVFEMAVYLLLAIGCLRCLNLFNPISGMSGLSAALGHDFLLRREFYAFCVRATVVLTILIIVTLPVMHFW